MAALLPGASAPFSVKDETGRLGARIEQTFMANLNDRLKFLKAKVPDVVDLELEKLLRMPSAKLQATIGDSSLVLVRSQEIDIAGESGFARQVMDTVLKTLLGRREARGAGIDRLS